MKDRVLDRTRDVVRKDSKPVRRLERNIALLGAYFGIFTQVLFPNPP